jgi:nicotinate-nucleotide--dimethylbenzimidazole phosphoribosyltransferase
VRLALVAEEETEDASIAARAEALNVALHGVNLVAGDAPDAGAIDAAIEAGISMADSEADAGTDLLLLALPGAVSATMLAVACACSELEPAKVIERGITTTDPQRWMARLAAIRDQRARMAEHSHDPQRVLRIAAEPALAFATGLLLQSAARRTPVVLDGTKAITAAVAAAAAVEDARGWWAASDLSAHPVAQLAAARLDLLTVLNLSASTGDGSSALLSVPILREATRVPQTGARDADEQH